MKEQIGKGCSNMLKGRRSKDGRYWYKRWTSRAARRQAKRELDDAPKGYKYQGYYL